MYCYADWSVTGMWVTDPARGQVFFEILFGFDDLPHLVHSRVRVKSVNQPYNSLVCLHSHLVQDGKAMLFRLGRLQYHTTAERHVCITCGRPFFAGGAFLDDSNKLPG